MSIVEVPIDKVIPGMYLEGVDIPWEKCSFVDPGFVIALKIDVDKLVSDGVKVVYVDNAKSSVSCVGFEQVKTTKATTAEPAKKTLEPVEYDEEVETVKHLRKETVDNLKKIFLSSLDGEPVKKEQIDSIVTDSHDSILRNTHALLAMFHLDDQQSDLENHSFNVMSLSLMLGERVGLNDDEISILGSAALLMDIGWSKLSIDLFKNGSSYTDEEFEMVKTHIDFSVDILEEGDIDPEVVSLVAKHHERMDGTGYFSYHGDHDVPLMNRILSIADHYNSRIRGYYDSPPMIPSSVLKEIYGKAKNGSHDERLTQLLVQLVGIYPVSSAVKLNSGEKGIVKKVNWRDAMFPLITVFYDRYGKKLPRPIDIDLSKQDKNSSNIRKIEKLLNLKEKGVDPAGVLVFKI